MGGSFSKSNLLYVAIAHTCCMILDRIVRVSMTYYLPVINQRIDAIFLQRVVAGEIVVLLRLSVLTHL